MVLLTLLERHSKAETWEYVWDGTEEEAMKPQILLEKQEQNWSAKWRPVTGCQEVWNQEFGGLHREAQCRISTGTYSTRFFARCISLSWIACFYELTFVHLPFEILVFFLSAYFISLYSQHIKLDLSYLLQKLFPKLLFTLYF